jgi:hypothetical protein
MIRILRGADNFQPDGSILPVTLGSDAYQFEVYGTPTLMNLTTPDHMETVMFEVYLNEELVGVTDPRLLEQTVQFVPGFTFQIPQVSADCTYEVTGYDLCPVLCGQGQREPLYWTTLTGVCEMPTIDCFTEELPCSVTLYYRRDNAEYISNMTLTPEEWYGGVRQEAFGDQNHTWEEFLNIWYDQSNPPPGTFKGIPGVTNRIENVQPHVPPDQPQPVDCDFYWQNIGCTVTCGGGWTQQRLVITTPAANGGDACPASNGTTRTNYALPRCNTHACSDGGATSITFSRPGPGGFKTVSSSEMHRIDGYATWSDVVNAPSMTLFTIDGEVGWRKE